MISPQEHMQIADLWDRRHSVSSQEADSHFCVLYFTADLVMFKCVCVCVCVLEGGQSLPKARKTV